VYTTFHQAGTATGRLSSTDPNLQNIPIRSDRGKEIRKAFVPAKNNIFISADYSQIDLRSLAHMSGDPVLIKTFQAGGDIHASTAAEVFQVPIKDVTSEMRQSAKAINFGIVYGQQAFALSQSLGIDFDKAKEFIQKYFERYSGIKTWMEKVLGEARSTGVVFTLAGRRRPVPDISSTNSFIRGFAERVAVNTPIQGTSADIIKMAMIKIHQSFEKKAFSSKLVLQVHDELLFDVLPSELNQVVSLVKFEMENAIQLKVPLKVDIKTGSNWSEMKKMDLEAA
jgi:DNA polymerase-1